MLFLLGKATSRGLHDTAVSMTVYESPTKFTEALTEVSNLVSTRPSWLQTLTHSSAILGLRVAFPAPSSEQGIGGWLEGRISGVALKYRQVPGRPLFGPFSSQDLKITHTALLPELLP